MCVCVNQFTKHNSCDYQIEIVHHMITMYFRHYSPTNMEMHSLHVLKTKLLCYVDDDKYYRTGWCNTSYYRLL